MLVKPLRLLGQLLVIAILATGAPPGMVLATDVPSSAQTIKSSYRHTAWTSREGAPNDIESIAQTRDGWLWLGAGTGLYRFDGVTFEAVDLRPASSTATRVVVAVMVASNGDLWVGYNDGAVIVAQKGDTKELVSYPGLNAETLAFFFYEDGSGDVWAQTNFGLLVQRGGKWVKPDMYPGFPTGDFTDCLLDDGRNFWVVSSSGVSVMRRGTHRFEKVSSNIRQGEDVELFTGRDGRPWAIAKNRVFPLISDQVPIAPRGPMPKQARHEIRTHDGSLWTNTCEPGLCRAQDFESSLPGVQDPFGSDRFTQADGMSSDLPVVIFEDREGTVWVATTTGLDSFRRNNFTKVLFPYPAIDFKMAPSDDGTLWVGTDANLPSGDNYLWHLTPSIVKIDGYRNGTSSLLREKNGDLLLSVHHVGMMRYSGGKFSPANLPPTPVTENRRAWFLMRDGEDKLWASFVSLCLYRLDGHAWIKNGGISGLPDIEPTTMSLASDGKLWLGYQDNDVRVVSHGIVEFITAKNGLQVGIVSSILTGKTELIAGELGVSIFSQGRWHTLRTTDPNALKGVTGIERSKDGAVWLNGSAGAVQIQSDDLSRAEIDPNFVLPVRVLTEDDGLPGSAMPISSSLAQTTDGKLWFSQEGGLAWIDPKNLLRNTNVPAIFVRSISTPTMTVAPSQLVTLPPKTTNLHIAYTALSMANPGRNRFKVKLDGIDVGWRDMGTRREVDYTNLGPATYRFHVKGSNGDGVWNEAGTDMVFRIEPTFFQTSWFLCFEVLACLFALYILFRFQIRRAAARERERVEIRHSERERLARELHDSFLQVLSFLLLRFDRIGQGLDPGERERLKVNETLDQAELALADGRDRVSALRDSVTVLTDIELCLAEVGNALSQDYPVIFSVAVHGRVRQVRSDVADEICKIGREALNNACRHAHATHVSVEIEYSRRRVALVVRDDGDGLPDTVQHGQRREGHWGLVGMRERAKTIGAELQLRTHPAGGTEVILRVSKAYIYG
ncbi:ATP-binding protein [Rhodanobacter sp. BL-MT-08]